MIHQNCCIKIQLAYWVRVSDMQDTAAQGLTVPVFTETFCSMIDKAELTVIYQVQSHHNSKSGDITKAYVIKSFQ